MNNPDENDSLDGSPSVLLSAITSIIGERRRILVVEAPKLLEALDKTFGGDAEISDLKNLVIVSGSDRNDGEHEAHLIQRLNEPLPDEYYEQGRNRGAEREKKRFMKRGRR